MRNAGRVVFTVFLALVTIAGSEADNYLEHIREAVSAIELGSYDQAASKLERALVSDESEPLGHMVLGTIYLHVGRFDEADKEFSRVLKDKPNEWRARYALGIISLLKGKRSDALKHMEAARQIADSTEDFDALSRYLSWLAGEPTTRRDSPKSELGKQIDAMALIKAGADKEALSLLAEITQRVAPLGFNEFRAPVVTFAPQRPIALPGGKLSWKPPSYKDVPVVSGEIVLRADASRTPGLAFISYYVDDSCVCVTNAYPYTFSWDTTRYPNGLHEVRVEGQDAFGRTISSKSTWVRVANKESARPAFRSGSMASELWDRIWRCVRLTESRKLVHYHLAKLFYQAGDKDSALKHFEYACAYDPNYADTRKRVLELSGRTPGYSELRAGPAGSKMVALTFDDGPNERTIETLEVLRRFEVPATFFLVGFRAEVQPDLVRAICDAGHEIENHTYSHPNLTTLTTDEAELELAKCTAVIRAITGKACRFFRPPGGHSDEATKRAAARHGLTGVYWTVNCSPWEGQSHVMLASNVVANTTDGAIILMHNGEPATLAALPTIISELRSKGYRFVTISEMAGR